MANSFGLLCLAVVIGFIASIVMKDAKAFKDSVVISRTPIRYKGDSTSWKRKTASGSKFIPQTNKNGY